MNGRFRINPFLNDGEDPDYSLENSEDSPRAAVVSTSDSPKKSRRAVQKRVVSVPIRDIEGSRLKGETPPPSDSWAWRKYGQKPIKGSPYPRGYYRCSSSKGCPARKQVERSCVDPTMLVVTYSFEHNHLCPASKNNNTNRNSSSNSNNSNIISNDINSTATATEVPFLSTPALSSSEDEIPVFENQFTSITEESLVSSYEFKWSPDLDSISQTTFEGSISGGGHSGGGGGAVFFPMGEEDESLFADLGELPECSVVFRRGLLEERPHCSLGPWCGTTG